MPLCPQCQEPLVEVASHGLTVQRCPRCKGFILDRDKIDHPHLTEFAVSEASRRTGLKGPAEKGFFCPFDGAKMDLSALSGFPKLAAPVCPQCRKAWIDAKQLFDSSPAHKPHVTKRPLLMRYGAMAVFLAALFFTGRFLVIWLPQHFYAGTLQGICIASGVLLFFALCGLGVASQDTDLDGGGGLGAGRMAFAGAIASIGEYFWKVLMVSFLLIFIISFVAWTRHPDKAKRPPERYHKEKRLNSQGRW